MKILLVDAGNSTIDFRSYDLASQSLTKLWRPETKTFAQWTDALLLQKLDWQKNQFTKIVTTSVLPQFDQWSKKWGQKFNLPVLEIKQSSLVEKKDFKKVNFDQLGADLITNFYARKWNDALIISLGTSTTICQIKDRIFQGVIIAPGIRKSLTSLIESAALLSSADFQWSQKPLGSNTLTAISLGGINGHFEMLKGFVNQLKSPKTKVIVTGGDADLIFPGLKKIGWEYDEKLIFDGLINLELQK